MASKKNYDYVLIDCMPSLGMITINALAAADSVIIPTQPHYLSAKGLELLLRSVSMVKRQINPKLRIDGILMTMVMPRTNISIGMLVVLDSILNRITQNRAKGRNTFIFIDEIYLLLGWNSRGVSSLLTVWRLPIAFRGVEDKLKCFYHISQTKGGHKNRDIVKILPTLNTFLRLAAYIRRCFLICKNT